MAHCLSATAELLVGKPNSIAHCLSATAELLVGKPNSVAHCLSATAELLVGKPNSMAHCLSVTAELLVGKPNSIAHCLSVTAELLVGKPNSIAHCLSVTAELLVGKPNSMAHFRNDTHFQLSLSLHFYVFYLLLNSCDGKDAKRRVFLGRLFVALKSVLALKSASFSFANVQSDVLLSSHMHTCTHTTAFSID